MIHALRYEPQGQRFEPREWPHGEQQDKHIYLHVHVHLSFWGRQRRSSPLSAIRMTRIFAALMGASAMAFAFRWLVDDNTAPTPLLYPVAAHIMIAGLLLAWSTMALAGLPLLVSAWRSKPPVLFLLAVPLLIGLFQPLFLGLYLPVLSGLGFECAMRQAAIADKWLRFASRLSFVAVGGMVLLLFGGVLWCLSLVLVAPGSPQMTYPWYVLLPFLLGMGLAISVAVSALFGKSRSRMGAQTRPKDDSPADFDSPAPSSGYRG